MSFTCDLFLLGLVKENDNKDSNNEGNDNEDNNNKDNDNEHGDIKDSRKTRLLLVEDLDFQIYSSCILVVSTLTISHVTCFGLDLPHM